jgi:hypothetical protein
MYRYLWRLSWDANKRPLLVVGLMPSTADEEHADATVAKFIAIASNAHPEVEATTGFGKLVVMNMFARRPMPNHKRAAADLDFVEAVGDNDPWISREARTVRRRGGTVALAWGGDGWSRHGKVLSLLGGEAWCFGTTKPASGGRGFPLSASRSRVVETAKLEPYLDNASVQRLKRRKRREDTAARRQPR